MKSGYCILFNELNIFTLVIILFFKIIKFNTYFLRISNNLINMNIYNLLKSIEINKLHIKDLDLTSIGTNDCFLKYRDIIFNHYFKNCRYKKMIESRFNMDPNSIINFDISINSLLREQVNESAILIEFANYYKKNGMKVYLFANKDIYTAHILKNKYSNLSPIFYNIYYAKIFIRIFKLLFNKIYHYIKFNSNIKNRKTKNNKQVIPGHIDYSRFKVMYFPHEGIFYGDNLYIKDQFYHNDPKNPFFNANILHLSLNNIQDKQTLAYYNNQSITNSNFYQLKNSNHTILLLNIIKTIFECNLLLLIIKSLSISKFLFYLQLSTHLNVYLNNLASLTNVKLALIGYEILFPPLLSTALSISKIKIAAVQDRFMSPFWTNHSIILDYYFVYGKYIKNRIEEGFKWVNIHNSIPVGIIKNNSYENEITNFGKYKKIKEKYYVLLALDYLVPKNQIQNSDSEHNTIENIQRFYRDMIRISNKYSQIFIVIKGKNAQVINHPDFKDIITTIDNTKNITLETDLKNYNPTRMISIADCAVAMYTSMCDEMLALGKPVLFYDYSGLPSAYFDYEGFPVIVHTYKDLEIRISKLIKDKYFMNEKLFYKMRCLYYGIDKKNNSKLLINKELSIILQGLK